MPEPEEKELENPEPVDLAFAMNLPPKKAIEYFRKKGYAISFRWQDVWAQAHNKSFTVAGAMKMDILTAIREELDSAMAEGKTFRQFQAELQPRLQKQGWWGKTEIVDPKTGEVRQIDVTPARLRNIYRINMQTSLAAGRYQRQMEVADTRPYLRYRTKEDSAVRPEHEELNGTVLPIDDPWWGANYPPNDWGCRCKAISVSQRLLERKGWSVSTETPPSIAGKGWEYNPGMEKVEPALENYFQDIADQYKSAKDNYQPPED